jgi:hypothetical protein
MPAAWRSSSQIFSADAKASEIQDVECVAPPRPQSTDTLERIDVVVVGGADENSQVNVELVVRFPVVEAMNEPFEA